MWISFGLSAKGLVQHYTTAYNRNRAQVGLSIVIDVIMEPLVRSPKRVFLLPEENGSDCILYSYM